MGRGAPGAVVAVLLPSLPGPLCRRGSGPRSPGPAGRRGRRRRIRDHRGPPRRRVGGGGGRHQDRHRPGVAGDAVARCRSVDPSVRITVHGSDEPWATGSFATLQPAVGEGIDGVVATCWDPAAGGRRISGLRALAGLGTDVGAYLLLDRGWAAGELTDRRLQPK